MVETIVILLFGIIPGIFSFYLATTATATPPLPQGSPRRARYRRTTGRSTFPRNPQSVHLPSDAHHVDGLGYIIGDLSCQFNARSPHLRCAVNPSGPCHGCIAYQALQFPEESTIPSPNSPENSSI